MRKKVIAGNWKMFNNLTESIQLISELKKTLENFDDKAIVIVFPPFTSLETANELIKNSSIKLGAQNFYYEDKGAFTGEISASMLKSVGCNYVLVGHSERRTIFGETNNLINLKVKQALKNGLIPILCFGETLEERESNITESVIETQLKEGLIGIDLDAYSNIILAYEPVWAIGTGRTATPQQAQDAHKFVRKIIAQIANEEIANKIIIQYGGSVKPENAKELLSQADIDGALVGGACLVADSFYKIITSP